MIASARCPTAARGAPAGLRRGLLAPPRLARRCAPGLRLKAAGDGLSSGPSVPSVDAADFEKFVGSGYAIIDCYTDWCGPCKMIAPTFAELAADAGDAHPLRFAKFDCQSDPKRSSALAIKALPSFLAFKDGVEIGRMVGSSKDELRKFVATHRAAAETAVPAAAAV